MSAGGAGEKLREGEGARCGWMPHERRWLWLTMRTLNVPHMAQVSTSKLDAFT